MDKQHAKGILETWINCPVRYGDLCTYDVEEKCKGLCWSRSEVKQAITTIFPNPSN